MTFRHFRPDATVSLIVLVWAMYAIPRLVQTLTGVKRRATVGEALPMNPLAVKLELLLLLLAFALCAFVILRGTAALPTDRRVPLVLMLAPWVYVVIRDLYIDQVPTRGGMLYPLLVVAIWILRPQLRKLATLGYLVVLTAVVCIALGTFLPESGIYVSSAGAAVAPPKEILPLGILIGIFTDGNNLGQYLVLGLPTVMLIPRRVVRAAGIAVVLFAIVWTSSRSSLAAAVLACGAWTLMAVAPSVLRRPHDVGAGRSHCGCDDLVAIVDPGRRRVDQPRCNLASQPRGLAECSLVRVRVELVFGSATTRREPRRLCVPWAQPVCSDRRNWRIVVLVPRCRDVRSTHLGGVAVERARRVPAGGAVGGFVRVVHVGSFVRIHRPSVSPCCHRTSVDVRRICTSS